MPTPTFQTDEILWFENGVWGEAGYAVPNPAGKTFTNNTVIFKLHQNIGRTMFDLMHRPAVKFYTAPHKQFWFDLHALLVNCRKGLADRMRAPNDSNGLEPTHATPTPKVFIVYPVPFFGERIRQQDVLEYCQLCLLLLSEMMQHGDNEHATYVTPHFAGVCGKYVQEILALMSMRYFGKTRADAYAPDFTLEDADFTNYDPAKWMTSVEMTEERPPLQWWPTENDLSKIRGIPITDALVFAKRWPSTAWLDQGDGNVFPASAESAVETATPTGFQPPPGQAP